ncbi:hypothetical protein CONCODRAFT_18385 [Conidiobolus coronatus NRRL 28638]|uniref:Transcription factor IIIC subunit 5 HTH domain-containing protein n=1 Tax=Conidiobolus coronatus (strain ATCC 28846 / CBS 209.66 / NRRL 28638) TaxID=796925 RepID=A0A137P2S6_CONC2|nr:hypothetical protein CONCODRAFT_18385 [Conidiobolus coronatus NRRL 28638]|eukprot:KXN69333.1 hypothetical protein CONCODRAFT_18385 [Conidiobolus coronatus NRRL 28638]
MVITENSSKNDNGENTEQNTNEANVTTINSNLENLIQLPDYEKSPTKTLPNIYLFNIEYPGYVKNLQKCLDTLGGLETLTKDFLNNGSFDLRYRPQDPLSHPISGDNIDTRKFLLKVTRRVRIKKKKDGENGHSSTEQRLPTEEELDNGEVLSVEGEVAGFINNTLKFRSLADFQYICTKNHPAIPLTKAIISGNTNDLILQGNTWLNQNYTNLTLPLIPPPMFSRTENYFDYKFQQAQTLRKVMVKSLDGKSYSVKYKNMRKSTRILMIVRKYDDDNIPLGPSHQLLSHRSSISPALLEQAQNLFEERPVWARHSFMSRIPRQKRVIYERLLPQVAYLMTNGPWRDCWIRYGYNPKKDPGARFYQILDMRSITTNKQVIRAKRRLAIEPRELTETKEQQEANTQDYSFIFRSTSTNLRAIYQYSDVVHPRVRRYIESERCLRDEPVESTGWYHEAITRKIRKLVKSILENPDEEMTQDDTDEELLIKKYDYDKAKFDHAKKPTTKIRLPSAALSTYSDSPSSQSNPMAVQDTQEPQETQETQETQVPAQQTVDNPFDAFQRPFNQSQLDQFMGQLSINPGDSSYAMDFEDTEQYANVFGSDDDEGDLDYEAANKFDIDGNDDDDDDDDDEDDFEEFEGDGDGDDDNKNDKNDQNDEAENPNGDDSVLFEDSFMQED